MKTKNRLYLGAIALMTMVLSAGCSDSFLEDKKDYSKVTADLYKDYAGCLARINNIYTVMLPVYNGDARLCIYPSSGTSDIFSASTEEYSGLTDFVDPGKVVDYTSVGDYFYYSRKTSEAPYGHIRNCNDAIIGIEGSNGITEEQKKKLLGQAYFFRAWVYYRLVKVYGGVPIITTLQDPIGANVGLHVERSTTKACVDFICNDLQKAADCLPESWDSGDKGRVTSGTALALMGRLKLLYASPLFNRSDDKERWESAYQVNKQAIERLTAGKFGLAYVDDEKMKVNAKGWAKMYSDYTSPEAVFVTLYNNLQDLDDGTAKYKNNGWENSIRPLNACGGGGRVPSAMLVDLFPMADGKKSPYCSSVNTYAKLQTSALEYSSELPFLNRDPRFYRTFAFPGVKWQFGGDLSDRNVYSADSYPYDNGNKYELWNYSWYTDTKNRDDDGQSGYGADGLLRNYKGFYIRKKSDDSQVNNTPLYDFSSTKKFMLSAAPYMEMRYAEVLLNFAEAACGAGYYTEAVDALIQIRKRVGYTVENNYYGLGDLQGTSDRAKLFSAILYERQIELAYEGKRFDDMRRWMLFDGGIGQSELNSSWALTGFDSNTCIYLGVAPLNGQRRENLEFRVNNTIGGGLGSTTVDSDPIKGVTRPMALDLDKDLSSQVGDLKNFYTANLARKTRRGDEVYKTVTFQPQYYFLGLSSSAQLNNPSLLQTIGWGTYASGGSEGTFDPLAE